MCVCREVECACKSSGRECVCLERERESVERERERERDGKMESVCREREGVCFEIEECVDR